VGKRLLVREFKRNYVDNGIRQTARLYTDGHAETFFYKLSVKAERPFYKDEIEDILSEKEFLTWMNKKETIVVAMLGLMMQESGYKV